MVCWKANLVFYLSPFMRSGRERTQIRDYPNFHLTMHCYICKVKRGSLTLLEHEAAKWLTRDELGSVKWLPADEEVVEMIKIQSLLSR